MPIHKAPLQKNINISLCQSKLLQDWNKGWGGMREGGTIWLSDRVDRTVWWWGQRWMDWIWEGMDFTTVATAFLNPTPQHRSMQTYANYCTRQTCPQGRGLPPDKGMIISQVNILHKELCIRTLMSYLFNYFSPWNSVPASQQIHFSANVWRPVASSGC